MDEKLVFRRARPADAARIMEIIRQAQGCSAILIRSAKITAEIMDAIPTLKVVAKHGMGRTAIRQRPISDTTSLAATDGSSRNRRRKRARMHGEPTARGLRGSGL